MFMNESDYLKAKCGGFCSWVHRAPMQHQSHQKLIYKEGWKGGRVEGWLAIKRNTVATCYRSDINIYIYIYVYIYTHIYTSIYNIHMCMHVKSIEQHDSPFGTLGLPPEPSAPHHQGKHQAQHQPLLGKGIVIKSNSNQRYATTPILAQMLRKVGEVSNVPMQDRHWCLLGIVAFLLLLVMVECTSVSSLILMWDLKKCMERFCP